MKNGLIYARVSTEEQAKEGLSIEGQIKLCTQFAEQNDIEIVTDGIYTDQGKSATNTNRPALQNMLTRITEEKTIDCILILDTDRLARNTLDHLSIKSLCEKHRVQIISISQPLIDDSPEGNFIDTVLAATNALQSQITGRKTSKILEQKAKAGYWPRMAPIGYINTSNPHSDSNLNKRIIEPDPIKGPLIQRMFEEYATGKHNLGTLSKKMYKLGLKSKTGSEITKSHIASTLNHQIYYGDIPWKDKVYKGKHKPLITRQLWDTCQNVLADHNQHASRKRKHTYILRGYLYCEDTGERYWAGPHKGRHGGIYHYYFRKSNSAGTYVKQEIVEDQVTELFKKVTMSPSYISEILDTAKQIIEEQRGLTKSERQSIINRQNGLRSRMRQAEDRLLDETLSPDQFKSIMDRLNEEYRNTEYEMQKLDVDYSEKFEVLKRFTQVARNVHQSYKDAETLELKRNFIRTFFDKIYIKDGKITHIKPSANIAPLVKEGKIGVQVGSIWGPSQDLTRNLLTILKGNQLIFNNFELESHNFI